MSDSSGELILVVDDRMASRYATSRVLQNAGFRIVEAGTGTQALEIVSPEVSLVVLDVNLPDIDGQEVCRRIRQRPDVARLPVVHLSATFISDNHKIKGLEAGADGYLTHPVDPLVLVATVKSFLRARQMEAEVIRSEAKFRAVFDHAMIGICLITSDMIFLDANPAFCQILGREASEIIGKQCISFMSVGTENLVTDVTNHLESHNNWRGILPLRRADGQILQLDWNISIHSTPTVQLAVVADITEKLRFQAEREQLLESERVARAAAENANRLKDEFLATLSHELRTPLSAIIGWSQVLQVRPPTQTVLADGLAAIERNAKGQSELISDLLDVSRIISGKLRLNIEHADPKPIITNALAAVIPAAQAQGIALTQSLPDSCALIWCDPSRLQQVVWNLVNNAVKFTLKGGSVHVDLHQTDASVQLVVSDTGKGIKREFLPYIFERFRQEDSTTTREYGGLGLGLAIVRHLVELHGGTVTAQSAGEGCGAQFIVQLPQTKPPEESEPVTPSSKDVVPANHRRPLNHTELEGLRIMVVDDDHDTRDLTVRILKDFMATVAESASVNHALENLQSFDPHILISDIGMPHRDGYSLIREVRNLGYDSKRLPAVAVTAFARAEDRQKVLQEGYQAHLGKPVEIANLIATIANLAGHSTVG